MTASLGINFHHDTSACLIVDGRIYAAEEERWSGFKHNRTGRGHPHMTAPVHSLAWCLKTAGVTAGDINTVYAASMRPTKTCHPCGLDERTELANLLPTPLDDKLRLMSHHMAHVLSAYLLSDREHAAGLVIDAGGSALDSPAGPGRERISGYDLRPSCFERAYQAMPQASGQGPPALAHPSLGHFYRNLAQRCIPPGDEPEGSLMALAAFGDPHRYLGTVRDLVQLGENGQVRVAAPYGTYNPGQPLHLADGPWTAATAASKPLHLRADLAASTQMVFSATVAHVARHLRRLTGARSLVFSGGCALNSRLNGDLAAVAGFDDLYIAPAPHDAGTAVGAALYGWVHLLGQPRPDAPLDPDWGPHPGHFNPHPARVASLRVYDRLTSDQRVAMAADLLADGSVIGWVQGGLEFGPRALGHRSILAHPGSTLTRDRINTMKQRAGYRPLAPAILAESADDWFDGTGDPFMNRTAHVRPGRYAAIAGAVHRDGTARLQRVEDSHSGLSALLRAFRARTDLPVLINTSFNLKGTPIVRDADQALTAFAALRLDALVIDNTVITRAQEVTATSLTHWKHRGDAVTTPTAREILRRLHADGLPQRGAARLAAAAELAVAVYAGHTRDQETPYLEHPVAVAVILRDELDVTDPELLSLALLHDALEITPQHRGLIATQLGTAVAERLAAMTPSHRLQRQPKTPEDEAAWRAKTSGLPADLLTVRLADRLHNLRDLSQSPNLQRRTRFVRALDEFYLPLARQARNRSPVLEDLCALLEDERTRQAATGAP